MRCPQRAERLWLVLSIALLLLTAWGDTTSMLAGVTRQQPFPEQPHFSHYLFPP